MDLQLNTHQLFRVRLFLPKSKNPAYSTDKEVIAGNEIFDNTCVACHNFRTTGIGPNLAGVTREVPEQWLKDFIRNPVEVIQSGDRRGKELFEQYKQYMPPYQHLTDEELNAVLAYIHTRKARPDTPTRTEWGNWF
ncbi:MAG: cytochrome c [Bacteroidia bacterium]